MMAGQPRARKPIRRLDTVHFDDNVKRALLADIRNYLDPATKRRYQRRCMPYRRGYLLYGPPGTGKSSLSTALAGEFGLDLYELKMPSLATDAELELAFQDLPRQCIVLLEDIDAVWAGDRSSPRPATPTPPPMTTTTGDSSGNGNGNSGDGGGGVMLGPPARSGCTLSGLLNVLDGVGSHEGRIVIMTTNHADRLDGALVRPGRVDMKIFLGNISPKAAEQMFVRMFAPDYVDVDAATTPALTSASSAEANRASPSSSGHGGKEEGADNYNKNDDTDRRIRDNYNSQTNGGSSSSNSPREKGSEKKSDANPTMPTTTGPLDTTDPYGAELAAIRALAARFAAQVPADTFTPSQLQGFFQLHLDSAVEAADHIAAWVARERPGATAAADGNEDNEGLVVVHHPPVVVEGRGE